MDCDGYCGGVLCHAGIGLLLPGSNGLGSAAGVWGAVCASLRRGAYVGFGGGGLWA